MAAGVPVVAAGAGGRRRASRLPAQRSGSSPGGEGLVVYRGLGGIDAIEEHSRRLAAALTGAARPARYEPGGLPAVLSRLADPAWIVLQYNPFRYGRNGFAPRLLRDLRRLRSRSRAPVAVMVHEAWIDITDPRSAAIGLWQRAQLRDLLRGADAVMTSTAHLARTIGGGAVHVPIAATITPVASSPADARARLALGRPLVVALFGRGHPSRALDYAEAAIGALVDAHGAESMTVLNLGAEAPAVKVPAGVEVHAPGELAAGELSLWMWAADLVLLPFADGLSTRRTTLMAALAHARPVLGLRGAHTEPELTETLAVTPVGVPAAYARAAVELTSDRDRLDSLGAAGAALYAERFDWPVSARRASAVIDQMRAQRTRGITFVAHHVGGAGGMERHTEELIGRLLDVERPVTVIARRCSMEPRPGLGVRRIRTPRKPFVLAYPAFFLAASLVAARRRDALLHTTGALIANRADVCTVHYCHNADGARAVGSRANRPGLLPELNQKVGARMSRLGERWCYRPERAGLLCAVSNGVARELELEFPRMQGSIRSIPNGVDAAAFAPDPGARAAFRERLGVAEDTPVALFAGGDWDRKGLGFAVAALARAPEWHLAVAGDGDRAPLLEVARRDATAERLHFLGRVDDMPRVYAAADAFVFPTSYEAFPLVVLEAAASALPILITAVNGATELIIDDESGWFIERDADDIAARLNELLADPRRARAMAAHGRATARRYSWDAMADAYLSIYGELTDNRDDR